MRTVKVPNAADLRDLRVIDTHVHMSFRHTIGQSEEYYRTIMQGRRYDSMVFVATTESSKGRDPLSNVQALWFKRAFAGCRALASLVYRHDERDTAEEFLRQAKEARALGFEGMKMLEGKPNVYRNIGIPLDSPAYEKFFAYLEENGIPVTMHLGDPAEFWDADKVSEYAKKAGWFYGDPSYPTREKLYNEVWNILTRHPALKLNLAHFGFFGDRPELAEEYMGRWKNTCLDLTPGGCMFTFFSAKPDYWKDYFYRYSDRILFGTDTYNLPENHEAVGGPTGRWGLVRTFLEYKEPYEYGSPTGTLIPFGFEDEMLNKLYRENALSLFGNVRAIDEERAGLDKLLTKDSFVGMRE